MKSILPVFFLAFATTKVCYAAVTLTWNTTGYTQYGMPNGEIRAVVPAFESGISFGNTTGEVLYQERATAYQTATSSMNFGVSLLASRVYSTWNGEFSRFQIQENAPYTDVTASYYQLRYSIGIEADTDFEITYRFEHLGSGGLQLNQGYAAPRLGFADTDGEWITSRFSAGTYYLDFYSANGFHDQFGSSNWGGNYDITFNAVPEPSTWALMGIGAMVLGFAAGCRGSRSQRAMKTKRSAD